MRRLNSVYLLQLLGFVTKLVLLHVLSTTKGILQVALRAACNVVINLLTPKSDSYFTLKLDFSALNLVDFYPLLSST